MNQQQQDLTTTTNLDTLLVMRKQEDNIYYCPKKKKKVDYYLRQQRKRREGMDAENANGISSIFLFESQSQRAKLCTWCMQIVDYCQYNNREIVEITMNYFDRWYNNNISMSTNNKLPNNKCSPELIQLACITCLYLAIKVYERKVWSPILFSQVSNGSYTPEQIEAMERSILQNALHWHVHPPTAMDFCRSIVPLLRFNGNEQDRSQQALILDLAQYQTERAIIVQDVRLLSTTTSAPSRIAHSAIMNAVEHLHLIDYNNGSTTTTPASITSASASSLNKNNNIRLWLSEIMDIDLLVEHRTLRYIQLVLYEIAGGGMAAIVLEAEYYYRQQQQQQHGLTTKRSPHTNNNDDAAAVAANKQMSHNRRHRHSPMRMGLFGSPRGVVVVPSNYEQQQQQMLLFRGVSM